MEYNVSFSKKKLVDQVAEDLKELIKINHLSTCTNFPSSRWLAQKYGVSHNVMLKVLRQLNDENVLYLISRRKGYEVNMECNLF